MNSLLLGMDLKTYGYCLVYLKILPRISQEHITRTLYILIPIVASGQAEF